MRLPVAVLACCAAASTFAAPAPRIVVSSEWVENISRSSSSRDWQDGLRLRAQAISGVTHQIGANVTALAEAEARAEATPKFENQKLGELTLRGELRRKFGLGPLAPTIAATAALSALKSGLAEQDGFRRVIAVRGAKRFNESWRAAAQIEWSEDFADAAVFDASHRRLGAEFAWDITPAWQLSAGAARLDGTFTANASWFVWDRALRGLLGSAIQNYYTASPQAVTDSYGPGWVSYLVSGRVTQWWVQLSPALSARTSLALRFENNLATNIVNVSYRTTVWSATLSHQF
jgi:hypothetical protein